jgi:hypothetical protein
MPKITTLDKHCKEALAQIEANSYDAGLLSDGMDKIIKYGIAFYKKNCKVTTSGVILNKVFKETSVWRSFLVILTVVYNYNMIFW